MRPGVASAPWFLDPAATKAVSPRTDTSPFWPRAFVVPSCPSDGRLVCPRRVRSTPSMAASAAPAEPSTNSAQSVPATSDRVTTALLLHEVPGLTDPEPTLAPY